MCSRLYVGMFVCACIHAYLCVCLFIRIRDGFVSIDGMDSFAHPPI